MKSIFIKYLFAAATITMIFVGVLFAFKDESRIAIGSTIQGNDYQATTTAENAVYGSFTSSRLIKTGYGALGTVNITGANTGAINFYDATTTDITKRTGNVSSSSILIASIPASLTAGDYVFDIALSRGLYIDLVSGNMPTTTISYR